MNLCVSDVNMMFVITDTFRRLEQYYSKDVQQSREPRESRVENQLEGFCFFVFFQWSNIINMFNIRLCLCCCLYLPVTEANLSLSKIIENYPFMTILYITPHTTSHCHLIKLLSCTVLWLTNESVCTLNNLSFFFHNASFNSFQNNEVLLKDGRYLSCLIYQAGLQPTCFANGF